MLEYRALEIYDVVSDKFTCPFCKDDLDIVILKSLESKVYVICKKCKKNFIIIPPKTKKELIYLDQWFISNLYSDSLVNDKLKYYESLIEKLEELVRLQRIYIVTSDIHARETSKFQISDKQKIVWDKFNSLAKGNIAKHGNDIFLAQYKRILLNQKEEFHWSDILHSNPHEWIVGTNIISTNNCLVNYHKRHDPTNDHMNNLFRQICFPPIVKTKISKN